MSELAEKLKKCTKEFALRVIIMSASIKRSIADDVLARQIIRSATSVGANYREAYRARSNAEFPSKMGDCLREIEETGYWLDSLEIPAKLQKRDSQI